MRKSALLAFLLAVPVAFAQKPAARHAVIISIDGFASYSLKDPALPLPNIRRLIASGAVADSMKPVNPTVTWPNHTSIITGVTAARHSVLYNGQAQRTGEGKPLKVEPWVDKQELVAGPTLYDLAFRAKLTTAEIDWVAISNPKTISFAFPEVPKADQQIPREMVTAGLVSEDEVARFGKLPIYYRDEIWTRAAEHIIMKHRPNLMLFHLLTTDSLQHAHGARSAAGYTALAYADSKVGRIVDALRKSGILGKTAIFIVSDHGFKTSRHAIHANALLAEKGLADSAFVIPEGGTAMVYVTRSAEKATIVARLRAAFAGVEGIDRILGPDSFAKWGYPAVESNPRMADLVLAAKEGYAFKGAASGPPVRPLPVPSGDHGYLNDDAEIQAVFAASGAGIRPGVRLGAIRNLDVAPTVARLLGLKLENVEGRVLDEILK